MLESPRLDVRSKARRIWLVISKGCGSQNSPLESLSRALFTLPETCEVMAGRVGASLSMFDSASERVSTGFAPQNESAPAL